MPFFSHIALRVSLNMFGMAEKSCFPSHQVPWEIDSDDGRDAELATKLSRGATCQVSWLVSLTLHLKERLT